MKNPFKLKNVTSSLVAIALGGAGNVAMDYIFDNVEFLQTLGKDGGATSETTKNAIKVAVGAIGGALVPNKYSWAKSALDGTAIVGMSSLISGIISDKGTSGLPEGTIGRIRLGQRGFRPAGRRVAGLNGASFMEA